MATETDGCVSVKNADGRSSTTEKAIEKITPVATAISHLVCSTRRTAIITGHTAAFSSSAASNGRLDAVPQVVRCIRPGPGGAIVPGLIDGRLCDQGKVYTTLRISLEDGMCCWGFMLDARFTFHM